MEIPLSAVTESRPKVTYHILPKPYVTPKVKRDFRPKTETESRNRMSAESAHLSTFGAETEIRSTSNLDTTSLKDKDDIIISYLCSEVIESEELKFEKNSIVLANILLHQ